MHLFESAVWKARGVCLAALLFFAFFSQSFGYVLTNDPTKEVPIIISEKADDRTKEAARDLSQYLSKIFGRPFPVRSGVEDHGIILGTAEEFPKIAPNLKIEESMPKETYFLGGNDDSIQLIGITSLGAQSAVWEFLHRLGYRHYFSPKKWEIIPKLDSVDFKAAEVNSPAYRSRNIGMSFGMWPDSAAEEKVWERHNRLDSGFALGFGHAYDRIHKHNEKEFWEHPEYIHGNKFIVENEGLRNLVVADSLRQFESKPMLDSISVDPSDGGGWPKNSSLGSPSNQVVTLANEVARAVREKWQGKKVSILAYNEHSNAPTIPVDKDVIVLVATRFNTRPVDVLMDQWREGNATLGMRDYFSYFSWTKDFPGASNASNPKRLIENIAHYYSKGARYYVTEATDAWGPDGLGIYMAARTLWDINENRNFDAMREEFLTKSFGSAKPAMTKYYDLIDGKSAPLISDDLLARMYLTLKEAYSQTQDESVLARIDDLVAYTRYVELFSLYLNTPTNERQAAFEKLVQYCANIRDTRMMHSLAMVRDQPLRDKSIKYDWQKTKDLVRVPPTRGELQAFVNDGIANYKLLTFTPKSFDDNLVPLMQKPGEGDSTIALRQNDNILYTYTSQATDELIFYVKGGQIYSGKYGPVKIEVFPRNHPLSESVAKIEIPADKQEHEVKIKPGYAGPHRIEISDGGDMSLIRWPNKFPLALLSQQMRHFFIHGAYSMYFYVPKGVTQIGGYASNPTGSMVDGSERVVFDFAQLKKPGFFDVPVPKGEDGKIWKLERCGNGMYLMTVPPYLSPDRDGLLVPKDVINKRQQ